MVLIYHEVYGKKKLIELLDKLIFQARVSGRWEYCPSDYEQASIRYVTPTGTCNYTVTLAVDTLDRMKRRVNLNSYKPKKKSVPVLERAYQ